MFGLGGEINRVPPRATAFVHRDGLFVFAAETSWDVFGASPPRQSYRNFPDPELKDRRRACYGHNHDRLVRVKRNYDPTGFFDYAQAIGS